MTDADIRAAAQFCRGCAHYRSANGNRNYMCMYAIDMSCLRGCPIGSGCCHHTSARKPKPTPIVSVGRKPKPKTKIVKKGPRHKIDRAKALSLYFAGKSDAEIAAAVGSTVASIKTWRSKKGLRRSSGTFLRVDHNTVLQLAVSGISDAVIAAKLGIAEGTVKNIRLKHGIKRR